MIYRSDVFNPMSESDRSKLGSLRLRFDYDLRTTEEIEAQPDQVPPAVDYVHLDVLADESSSAAAKLGALLQDPRKATAELGGGKVEGLLSDTYRHLVTLPSARKAYRELFVSLSDEGRLPAVFHCTTGKDRTGWATAALLALLGVPREAIFDDYLRTNEYLLPYYKKHIDAFVAAGGDQEVPVAIFGVKREYLEAAFDEMSARYGSIENYFSQGLGLDVGAQQKLRNVLLKR